MKHVLTALAAALGLMRGAAVAGEPAASLYDITVQNAEGKDVALADYKGKVLLIVNVASRCGFTPQYAGLEQLYGQFKEKGLVVLGFPANNFMGQEPGTDAEIQKFCRLTYGVSFPVLAKISVKGSDQHPLYRFLTNTEVNPASKGAISWNFNKFLIGRDGKVISHYGSRTAPMDKELVAAIEKALETPAERKEP